MFIARVVSVAIVGWTLTSRGRPGLAGHASSVSAFNDRMYTFGGLQHDGSVVNEVWSTDGAGLWLLEHYHRSLADPTPPKRMYAASTTLNDTLVVTGGWDPGQKGSGGVFFDDVWKYNVMTRQWSRSQCMLEDGAASRHVMEAINATHAIVHTFRCKGHVLVYDVQQDVMTKQPVTGDEPDALSMQASAMSLGGERLVLFGGAQRSQVMTNDVFVLDMDAWHWTRRRAPENGDLPSPRAASSMCTHVKDGCFFVFAGAEGRGLCPRNDLWMLDMSDQASSMWTRVPCDDAPPARVTAAMERLSSGRVVVTGGWSPETHEVFNDTFAL